MATSREQIISEYKKYFPDREVSEDDIRNAQEKGLGVIGASYSSITGEDINTAQQQGQAGGDGTTPLAQQIQSIQESREELAGTQNLFMDQFRSALEAKQSQVGKLEKQRANVKEDMMSSTLEANLEGLSPQGASNALANKMSRLRAKASYFDRQKENLRAEVDDVMEQARGAVQDQLAQYGLQLEDLTNQYQMEQQAVQFAFSSPVLAAGVMPDNLPPQYHDTWRASSDEMRRQIAVKEAAMNRGSGGGRARTPGTPKVVKFGGKEFLYQDGQLVAEADVPPEWLENAPSFDQWVQTKDAAWKEQQAQEYTQYYNEPVSSDTFVNSPYKERYQQGDEGLMTEYLNWAFSRYGGSSEPPTVRSFGDEDIMYDEFGNEIGRTEEGANSFDLLAEALGNQAGSPQPPDIDDED